MLLLIFATVTVFVLSGYAYSNGRMKLPISVAIIALLDLYLIFVWGIGFVGLAIMGLLGVIMAITFKLDVG